MLHIKTYKNSGPLFVFLHGYGLDARVWHEFIQENHLNALSIDLPGYGESVHISCPNSIRSMAQEVERALRKKVRKDIILVGHSMGGYIALDILYHKYVENIRGLVLFHSHPFADDENKKENRRKQIDFIDNYGHEVIIKNFIPALFGKRKKDNFAIHAYSLRATQTPKETWIKSQEAMIARMDYADFLKSQEIPTLYILGENDSFIEKESLLKHISEHNCSHVEVLQNVGHMGMIERPYKCGSVLKAFSKNIQPK